MMDGTGWWMGAGSLIVILSVVLVIWLFVRSAEPREPTTKREAADILAERFANGEIDEQEYRSRLDALRR